MAKEKENNAAERRRTGNTKYRDSSSKIIFEDPVLCSQFLRGYTDIPALKDVRPEDIEDVTERYVHLFTEERNSDVVKKIYFKDHSFYLLSLIEHKSDVDYNVVMQVFRYITFIWEDYENEQEKMRPGVSRTKEFRYPPVLPVVFYDGAGNWTAAARLHELVLFSDVLGKYIPDYECVLVQLRDYSNADLMEKKDELSVLMMIDRLKNVSDYAKLRDEMDEAFLKEATEDSPEYLLKLMAQIIEVFLIKMNVPRGEAELFTDRIKEREMGELFKHFEAWDVQAVRREAEKEVKEAREEAQKELEKALKEAKKEALKEALKEIEKEAKKETERGIQKLLKVIKELSDSKETAMEKLIEEYGLTEKKAEEKIALYW